MRPRWKPYSGNRPGIDRGNARHSEVVPVTLGPRSGRRIFGTGHRGRSLLRARSRPWSTQCGRSTRPSRPQLAVCRILRAALRAGACRLARMARPATVRPTNHATCGSRLQPDPESEIDTGNADHVDRPDPTSGIAPRSTRCASRSATHFARRAISVRVSACLVSLRFAGVGSSAPRGPDRKCARRSRRPRREFGAFAAAGGLSTRKAGLPGLPGSSGGWRTARNPDVRMAAGSESGEGNAHR